MKKKIITTVLGVVGVCTIGHFMLLGLICLIVAIISCVELIIDSRV